MLKKQPDTFYHYRVMEPIEILPSDNITKTKRSIHLEKDDLFKCTKNGLNSIKFKLLWTSRQAFVGDMQDTLNKALNCDLKERWIQQATTQPKTRTEVILKEVYVDRWIPTLLIERFKKWIKSKFTKKVIMKQDRYEGYPVEEVDNYFIDLVYKNERYNGHENIKRREDNPHWRDTFKYE